MFFSKRRSSLISYNVLPLPLITKWKSVSEKEKTKLILLIRKEYMSMKNYIIMDCDTKSCSRAF